MKHLSFAMVAAIIGVATVADAGGVARTGWGPTEEAVPLASCVSWDIQELCCPGYCAAKNGSNWSSADKLFAACIVGLGCKEDSTSGFLSCDCPKK